MASRSSPRSLGSTLGSGKLSMASACLLVRLLNSQADVGSGASLSLSLRRYSQCRSLYHCSSSITRRSRFALPLLYRRKISRALSTSLCPMARAAPGMVSSSASGSI